MKVYVLGDSISIQYGTHLKRFLSGIMEYSRKEGEEEAMLDLDTPLGANGGDSSMVLSFLKAKSEADGIDADVVMLNCGLHDIKTDPTSGRKEVPLELYRENLQSAIHVVAAMRLRLLWVRTTPCDEKVHNRHATGFHRFAADCEAYNQAADRIMTEAGIPIIDLHRFTLNLGADLYCDHVHFREDVCKQQAAFIAGWLASWQQCGFSHAKQYTQKEVGGDRRLSRQPL
jgi:lysophospholipase L1-like esterase